MSDDSTLEDPIALARDAVRKLTRCLFPVELAMAEHATLGEPLTDDDQVLGFMGSGASDRVTSGEVREALTLAHKAEDALTRADVRDALSRALRNEAEQTVCLWLSPSQVTTLLQVLGFAVLASHRQDEPGRRPDQLDAVSDLIVRIELAREEAQRRATLDGQDTTA